MTINPRLFALAAKLDAANECARRLEARQNEDDTFIQRDAKEQLCAAAYVKWPSLNGGSQNRRRERRGDKAQGKIRPRRVLL